MKKRGKAKSSEFAVVLVSGLETSISDTERLFRDSSFFEEIPASLRYETARLMVSAFDAGIVSGSESQLRESIRSYFHALVGEIPFDVDGRLQEYASATERNAGSPKYLENIGHVFATHVGSGDANAFVASMAASAWANTYKMIVDLLNREIRAMEYVPYSPSNLKELLDRIT